VDTTLLQNLSQSHSLSRLEESGGESIVDHSDDVSIMESISGLDHVDFLGQSGIADGPVLTTRDDNHPLVIETTYRMRCQR
jgi:hypothetical protein